MTTKMTVELPDDLIRDVRAEAARMRRSFDDVLAEWIRRASKEPPLESLSDAEVLAICDYDWEQGLQEELSGLLDGNREGELDAPGKERLEALMGVYRRDLVRKAQALHIAVTRGIRPRLG